VSDETLRSLQIIDLRYRLAIAETEMGQLVRDRDLAQKDAARKENELAGAEAKIARLEQDVITAQAAEASVRKELARLTVPAQVVIPTRRKPS